MAHQLDTHQWTASIHAVDYGLSPGPNQRIRRLNVLFFSTSAGCEADLSLGEFFCSVHAGCSLPATGSSLRARTPGRFSCSTGSFSRVLAKRQDVPEWALGRDPGLCPVYCLSRNHPVS